MEADIAAFMPLPTVAFDPCHIVSGRASSMALVRYRTNDYSVPTAFAHQQIVIKGYVDRIDLVCHGTVIASHVRSYEREDFIANPLHYLALLEHKPGALDQAAPLDGWVLSEPVHRLRRLMEARSGKEGRRAFIQVLRLCEHYEQSLVEWAAARALELGAISFDAVKMILLARLEHRPARLDMSLYPYLPRASVGVTDTRAYLGLMHDAHPVTMKGASA
jgi:hypothetical protein